MSDVAGFAKMVPGFEFLQGLMKNAGAAVPNMGQWIAPTLNPEELEKRINELKTVKFWLEQNARMLDATIQALEVQRMTLSTLKTMNVPMADLTQAMLAREPVAAPTAPPEPATQAPAKRRPTAAKRGSGKASAEASKAGVVDPMQWWGALTKQFTELASTAMKEGGGDVAKTLAAAAKLAPGVGAETAPVVQPTAKAKTTKR